MKIDDIKNIARQHDIKIGKAKKSDLVRSIQQAEGNLQCFDTDNSRDCGQHSCMWRSDCV